MGSSFVSEPAARHTYTVVVFFLVPSAAAARLVLGRQRRSKTEDKKPAACTQPLVHMTVSVFVPYVLPFCVFFPPPILFPFLVMLQPS